MGDLAARLADYGLTLDEHVVICDRRVVDEAVAALSAASPAPSLPEDAERVVERFEITHDPDIGMIHRPHPNGYYVRWTDYAEIERQLAEARAEIERLTPLAVAYDYLESPAGREMAEADRDRLAAENERLREALEPFAQYRGSDEYLKSAEDDGLCAAVSFTVGDFRRARAALALDQDRQDGRGR